MALIIFFVLAVVVLVTFMRPKFASSSAGSFLSSAGLMIAIAIPTYFFFGEPNYVDREKKDSISFDAVSPEQNVVLQTYDILLSQKSQDVDQWQDVAIALRLQRKFTKASSAYAHAGDFEDVAIDKASFYGAAGEVLIERDGGDIGEDAIRMFNKALASDPMTLGARYYLAKFNDEAGNAATALAHYREFLRFSDTDHPLNSDVNSKIFKLSGSAIVEQPRKIAPALSPEAIEKFKTLPEDEKAEFLQTMMIRRFDSLSESEASAGEWRDLARMLQRVGDSERAIKAYDFAIMESPLDEALRLERAQLTD